VDVGSRIKQALDYAGLNQSDLARALDTQPHIVGSWVNHGVIPHSKHLVRLPGLLGISGHWLLTGEGPMVHMDPGPEIAAYHQIVEIVDRTRLRPPDAKEDSAYKAAQRGPRAPEGTRSEEGSGESRTATSKPRKGSAGR